MPESVIVRVATANLCHGRHGPCPIPVPWRVRAAARRLDADVVGLCEVDRLRTRPHLWDQTAQFALGLGGTDHTFAATGQHLPLGRASGQGLVVRGAIQHPEVLALPGRARRPPRVALLAEVTVAGRTISVGVAHLQPGTPDSTDQLHALCTALGSAPGPTVLLGDFNLGPASVAPILDGYGFTLATGLPTFPRTAPRHRIDHVAVRGATVTSSTVVELPLSDHRAVIATLRVPLSDRR